MVSLRGKQLPATESDIVSQGRHLCAHHVPLRMHGGDGCNYKRWYLGAKAGERAAARITGRVCCKANLGRSPQSIRARDCRVHLVRRGAADITSLKL